MKLTKKIMIALLLGTVVGLSLNMFAPNLFTTLDSYVFYRNNYIILSVLLLTLIFYTIVLYKDLHKKKKV